MFYDFIIVLTAFNSWICDLGFFCDKQVFLEAFYTKQSILFLSKTAPVTNIVNKQHCNLVPNVFYLVACCEEYFTCVKKLQAP